MALIKLLLSRPIVLIMGGAALLRLALINRFPVVETDVLSLCAAAKSWPDFLRHRYMSRPLYFALLKIWSDTFGMSTWVSRIPSLVIGILSVMFFYLCGKRMGNRTTGLIAGGLAAVLPYFVRFSLQIYYYGLFILLILATLYFFMSFLVRNRPLDCLLCAAAACLMTATHPLGIPLIAACFVWVLVFYRRIRHSGLFLVVFSTGIIAAISFVHVLFSLRVYTFSRGFPTAAYWMSLLSEIFSGSTLTSQASFVFCGNEPLLLLLHGARITSLFFLLVGCVTIVRRLIRRDCPEDCAVFALFLLLVNLIFIPAMVMFKAVLNMTHVAVFVVTVWLVAAYGGNVVWQAARRKVPAVFFVLLCALLFCAPILFYCAYLKVSSGKDGYKNIAAYVRAHAHKGDVVLVNERQLLCMFLYFFNSDLRDRGLRDVDICGKMISGGCVQQFRNGDLMIFGLPYWDDHPQQSVYSGLCRQLRHGGGRVWIIGKPPEVFAQRKNIERLCSMPLYPLRSLYEYHVFCGNYGIYAGNNEQTTAWGNTGE